MERLVLWVGVFGAFGLASCGGNGGRAAPDSHYVVVHTVRVHGHAASNVPRGRSLLLAARGFEGRIVGVPVPGRRPRRPVIFTAGARARLTDAPSWAPDGRSFVAVSGNTEVRREARVVIVRVPSGHRSSLRPAVPWFSGPVSFSPDGRFLLITSGAPPSGGLYAYDLDRHEAVQLLRGPVASASWAPDGRRIAFGGGDSPLGGIEVLDLHSGSVQSLTSDGEDPAWSPDGEQIAFSSRSGGRGRSCGEDGCDPRAEIDVIRPDGSHRRRVTHTALGEQHPSWSPDGTRIAAQAVRRNYFDETSGLAIFAADGSCYRFVLRPSDKGYVALGPAAWRPTTRPLAAETGCTTRHRG